MPETKEGSVFRFESFKIKFGDPSQLFILPEERYKS